MSDDVLLKERRGRVLVLTLNRPQAKNAINGPLADELLAALGELDEDPDLTAGVLTGAGGSFSAGMDLKWFATEGPPVSLGTVFERGAQKPLVAAMEGFVLAGGFELALTCDLLVGTTECKFGIPEVQRGLVAGGGALIRLPARLPYGVAMELALTGDRMDAETAERYGLLARVVEPGKALDAAVELAERIAQNAPLSIAASKQMIQHSIGRSEADGWKEQGPLLGKVFTSKDAIEGSVAFAEKRTPNWSGE